MEEDLDVEDIVQQIRVRIREAMVNEMKKVYVDLKKEGWRHISLRLVVAFARLGYEVELNEKEILILKWA